MVDVGSAGRFSDAAEIYLVDLLLGDINPHLGPCATMEYRCQLQATKPTGVSAHRDVGTLAFASYALYTLPAIGSSPFSTAMHHRSI